MLVGPAWTSSANLFLTFCLLIFFLETLGLRITSFDQQEKRVNERVSQPACLGELNLAAFPSATYHPQNFEGRNYQWFCKDRTSSPVLTHPCFQIPVPNPCKNRFYQRRGGNESRETLGEDFSGLSSLSGIYLDMAW